MAWLKWLASGLAAVAAIGLNRLLPEPQLLPMKALAYASFVFIGALEGAFIGLAQSTLLKRLLPTLGLLPFTLSTILPAMLSWAVGRVPSAFFVSTATGAAQSSPPAPGVMLLLSLAGGAVGGLLIGAAQWLVLRRHVSSGYRWLLASMLGGRWLCR